MRKFTPVVAAAALAAAFLAAPAAQAGDDIKPNHYVMKPDKDGMMSRAEVMKMVEKTFEKHDTKKMGKLDKKQFETFLQELMKNGG